MTRNDTFTAIEFHSAEAEHTAQTHLSPWGNPFNLPSFFSPLPSQKGELAIPSHSIKTLSGEGAVNLSAELACEVMDQVAAIQPASQQDG